MGPLSQQEIDAAMGGFTNAHRAPVAGGFDIRSQTFAPPPPVADLALDGALADLSRTPGGGGMPSAPVMAPTYLSDYGMDRPPALSAEQVQAAQGAFGPPPAEMAPVVAPVRQPQEFVRDARPAVRAPAAAQPSSGGGGGGGLGAKVAAGRDAVVGSYDTLEQNKLDESVEQRARGQGLADIYDAEAAHADETAKIQHEQTQNTQNEHATYLAHTRKMIDDVASEKIDPGAFFHSGNGARDITVAIGAMLLGGLGGLASQGSGRNPGLEAVNAMINRDIDTQEKNIGLKRGAINARQSVYAQMREELGDKRLADDRFRLAALESAKNRILAFSAGSDSKIDAVRTQGAVGMLDQEQKKVQLSHDENALRVAQQNAGAQASAAAQRAQRDFENTLKAREMQIKQQDANTRELEAGNKGAEHANKSGDELRKATAEYASKLEAAGLPKAMTEIGALKAGLGEPGKDIPGMGVKNDAIAAFVPGGERILMSGEERINRNNIRQLALAYRNAVTGSGGSKEEMADIESSFLGARSTKELWAAVTKADKVIEKKKANIDAGAGPDVVKAYESNMAAQGNAPVNAQRGLGGLKK